MKTKSKAKYVLHHDDPPCEAQLDNGFCTVCNIHPDMQSTCFYAYCPVCFVKLHNMKCLECGKKYEKD